MNVFNTTLSFDDGLTIKSFAKSDRRSKATIDANVLPHDVA